MKKCWVFLKELLHDISGSYIKWQWCLSTTEINMATMFILLVQGKCRQCDQQRGVRYEFPKYTALAETSGVARDYIRNEGTRKTNLILYKNNYNLQRFKPPRKSPGTQWIGGGVGPKTDPKEKARFYIDVVAK
jgi:hypothetical protein